MTSSLETIFITLLNIQDMITCFHVTFSEIRKKDLLEMSSIIQTNFLKDFKVYNQYNTLSKGSKYNINILNTFELI